MIYYILILVLLLWFSGPAIDFEDLPSNLQALSVAKLRAVCASHGILSALPAKASKADIIELLESLAE